MKQERIQVFEHESLLVDEDKFTQKDLEKLELLHSRDDKYFKLIRNGVKFNQYVGVIQVGNTKIEILPKIDRAITEDQETWQKVLIGMIKAVHNLKVTAPTSSGLSLAKSSILDLYFEIFISECEQLVHAGLIKKYRQNERNVTALKGRLNFAKHLKSNLTNEARFFTCHTTYDREHPLNQVLLKTLRLIQTQSTNSSLCSRISLLLINFPELSDIKVNQNFFNRIHYNQKNNPYKYAMQIAKLLLLNFHPDLKRGRDNVLALMFDMNVLWERFVFKSLQKYIPADKYSVSEQVSKPFWTSLDNGLKDDMRPDIVISDKKEKKTIAVLDTKWKKLEKNKPSSQDLRQVYAYSKFHNNADTALIYPSRDSVPDLKGNFNDDGKNASLNSYIIQLKINETDIKSWQKDINDSILKCVCP